MLGEELLDFPLDLRILLQVSSHPSFDDRFCTFVEDHPGSYFGRRLVVRTVQGDGADGKLGRFGGTMFCVVLLNRRAAS